MISVLFLLLVITLVGSVVYAGLSYFGFDQIIQMYGFDQMVQTLHIDPPPKI